MLLSNEADLCFFLLVQFSDPKLSKLTCSIRIWGMVWHWASGISRFLIKKICIMVMSINHAELGRHWSVRFQPIPMIPFIKSFRVREVVGISSKLQKKESTNQTNYENILEFLNFSNYPSKCLYSFVNVKLHPQIMNTNLWIA